jgi:hypothetical protein
MNRHEKQAIEEVLESYFTPDSPEGLACAMYQVRKIYNEEEARRKATRRGETRHGAHGQDGINQPDAGTLGKTRQVARGEDPKRVDCREDQTGENFLANDQEHLPRS